VLWVLTKNKTLQSYTIEEFVEPGQQNPQYADNTPHGIVPIEYRPTVAGGAQNEYTIKYQLLDMWGRPTIRDNVDVDVIACNAIAEIKDGNDWAIRTTLQSISGQVTMTFRSQQTQGTEVVLARIV